MSRRIFRKCQLPARTIKEQFSWRDHYISISIGWVYITFPSLPHPRFSFSQELFFPQSQSRPTETLFPAQSGLTRELLTSKFHIDPRTSLRMPPELFIPLLSALVPATTSLLHKIFFDQSLHISHIQWIFLRLKS